ncbi:MAG: PAS domain S-box protein [Nitrospirae bacterium]|nr:PAS domain S-box protein [Nitrospirota bacterium]
MDELQKDRSGALTEDALKIREEQLRDAQRLAKIGSWRYDVSSESLWWSDELYRMFDLRSEDGPVTMERFLGRVHPEDREELKKQIESGLPYRSDYRILLPDGSVKYVHEEVRVHSDRDAKPIAYTGTAQDVTDRRKTEDQLNHSLSLLTAALESTADGILIVNRDGKIVGFNEQFARLWKIPKTVLDPHDDQKALDFVLDQLKYPDKFVAKVKALYATPEANSFDILEFKDGRTFERYSQPQKINGCPVGRVWSFRDITQQRRTEEKLLKSEERFRLAMQGANDGLWDWNLLTDEVYYSPRWKSMLGYAEDELDNTLDTWKRLVSPVDQDTTLALVGEVVEGHMDKFEVEFRMQHKGGHYLDILSRAILVRDDGGKPVRLIGTHVDITRRKKTEAALRESERRYRIFFDQSPDGVLLMNAKGEIVSFNDAVCEQLGYTREEFSTLQIADIDPVESQADISLRFEKVFRDGKDRFEVKHRTKQGDIRDVFVIIQTLELSGQMFFHTIWQDITDRRRAVDALRASERMLQTIIDTEPECVKLLDKDANLIMMNRAGLEMIEADSLEQVKGQSVSPLITAEYRQPFMDLTRRVFQGEAGKLLFEITGLKGRHLWMETHAVPLLNDSNEIFAALGVTRDVTARKAAEEKISRSEQFIRSILDTVDEGFIVLDRDYRILTANKAYCSQVGGCDEKIIGRHCYEISHKTERPCFEEGEECAARHAFEKGIPHTALHRHKDAGGNILYVETKAFPIKDTEGNVTSVIEVINNITEKYLLEEERLRTQKLESIGTLAGGIAHDCNNLLQGVFGYISMAKITHDQKEKSLAMLDQAEEALHLSVNLTTQLLTFSKGGKPLKKLIRIAPVIENAVKFALSGSHTDFRLDILSDLWTVEADAGQLAQVIQNIVLNANEAMAGSAR